MLGLLMKFLPEDKKALLELALRMVNALDTPEERKAAAEQGIKMFADGRVTVTEWSSFGKALGIFKPTEGKNNDR
jgi:hypothetical protein|tara:strand:- start:117 stop:341 length:225 start_codon:yes stop_codon:yes gene_type:complete